ncbi:nucleotidyltransferase substrate binding protein [Mangrovibacterium marinum]|uniref:Nucleotidyltransferase substrate binding protein (TIGR01987 family) n=1 Tax=Mangrovibacterium marinum TaxID=1639118 RepID=A0A2T5C059_9BACT|nr:nucleotidyltransferase substrate binding protein [Mangrovibacterium marinum]PTN07967.1 nucleotidyltransferase substrate binding protein (TIGR01987 family) [Mangrovibacterium marinum]
MDSKDIRWKQRFENYKKALATLTKGVQQYHDSGLSELEKQGLIQGFEFTHELSWKVMQDFLKEKGEINIYGSKDATRLAFNRGLLTNGEAWMNMIADRNLSSHTYQEEISEQILHRIVSVYSDLFSSFEDKMNELCLMD